MGVKAPIFTIRNIYNKVIKRKYMTQLSNRMTDKNLIELAKQQHENKQLSKYPGLIVNLPSYGKIYPESSVLRPGQLEMRYMTAYDEDILTNPSYIKEGILFDKLIESLVITPGFDINEITSKFRFEIFHNLGGPRGSQWSPNAKK